jgi:hypothetical protein
MRTLELKLSKNMPNDLQKNLANLYSKYKGKFIIQHGEHKIQVIMTKNTHEFSKLVYYSICYDVPNRDYELYPFLINFIDVIDKNINDNCYIAHIHKTDKISGSEMIKLVLDICRYVNVKTAYIYDGTTVNCGKNEYDLSYIKLLEKNATFYMKHGFDFMASKSDFFSRYFINKESKKKYIIDLVKKCKTVKNKDICDFYKKLLKYCTDMILSQDYKHFKQHNKRVTEEITWLGKENIITLITEANDMLGLLHNCKEVYLYQTMIRIFNDKDNCSKYDTLSQYITDNICYMVEFKNKKIIFDIYDSFKLLKELRYSYFYINL